MRIEIAYAEPSQQWLWRREVAEGTTLAQVVDDAEVRAVCPALQSAEPPTFGVWSKVVAEPSLHILQDGDRVEIYRPLTIDPKAARKARAEKAKSAR
ncbi:MAG: RnfH family protein [Paraperlucidibaca sp.]